LATAFAMTSVAYYVLPTDAHVLAQETRATGNSSDSGNMSEVMMGFVGVAFAMFTGIAVLIIAEARKELKDALLRLESTEGSLEKMRAYLLRRVASMKTTEKQVKADLRELSRIPSRLELLRISAIATASARYANAVANRGLTQRGAAIDVIVCDEVLKVIAELDGRNVKKRGDAGVGELKNIHENRRFFTRLCDPEWEQVWVYLNALHDSLVDAKLGDTEAARELGEVLHDLQDSARGGDDA